jgi:hypothetical protein
MMIGFFWVNWTNGKETIHTAEQVLAMIENEELAHQIEGIEEV